MIVDRFAKQPAEIFPASIDFAEELGTGETIAGGTVTAKNTETLVDTSGSVLSASAAVGSGTTLTKIVTGGTVGDTHSISFRATTSNNNVLEHELIMTIIED